MYMDRKTIRYPVFIVKAAHVESGTALRLRSHLMKDPVFTYPFQLDGRPSSTVSHPRRRKCTHPVIGSVSFYKSDHVLMNFYDSR